jgi:hypothetical protein
MTQKIDTFRVLVHIVMNFLTFFTGWGTVSFPRRTLLHVFSLFVGRLVG